MSSSPRRTSPSKVVAVAGANGSVGKHVVEELLKAGLHVIALLRKENPTFVSTMSPFGSLSVEVLDLNSQSSIESAIRKHSVDTVISAYSLPPGEWRTQIVLLEAAETAGVHRFAPTSFAFPCDRAWPNSYNEAEIHTEERLKTTKMQWTNFACGIFMNYFGAGSPNPSAMGYLPPEFKYVVDIENGTAELPGTGDDPVPFTEIHDVGRGVAHACMSDVAWVRETGYMIGERLSYNQALRLIEEISGRKTKATYLSKSELQAKISETTDEMDKLLLEVLLHITQRLFDFDSNVDKLVVGNPPTAWKGKTLRECVEQWWGAPQ